MTPQDVFAVANQIWAAATKSATTLIALAAFVLGIFNYLRERHRHRVEQAEKRSAFYLDACMEGYEAARKLLRDGSNDRATWIYAARALKHAKALAAEVTVDPHKRVLELRLLEYRGFFHTLLADKPAPFFYGVAQWEYMSVLDAAAASTAPETRAGRHQSSTAHELPTTALHAIWEASQWPENYADPLDSDFTGAEEGQLLCLFPGLYDFLEHRKLYSSASGRTFPVKPVPAETVEAAPEPSLSELRKTFSPAGKEPTVSDAWFVDCVRDEKHGESFVIGFVESGAMKRTIGPLDEGAVRAQLDDLGASSEVIEDVVRRARAHADERERNG